MHRQPMWQQLSEGLLGPTLADTKRALTVQTGSDYHVAQLPVLGLYHFAHAVQTSIDTNRDGRHAIALSLLRQAVEALTIVELGLVATEESGRLLVAWEAGKKSHGELRRTLEQVYWPTYGVGLWNEPWAEFFGSLAKAVQPYAHCSPEMIQWNIAVLSDAKDGKFVAGVGRHDAMKASRMALLQALVGWALGRILVARQPESLLEMNPAKLTALGTALATSNLLFEHRDWSVQLLPHVFMKPRNVPSN